MTTDYETNPPAWALDIDEIDNFSTAISSMVDYHKQQDQQYNFEQYLESKLPTVMWVKTEANELEKPILNEIDEPHSSFEIQVSHSSSGLSTDLEIQELLQSTGLSGSYSNYRLSSESSQILLTDQIAIAGLRGRPKYINEDSLRFRPLNKDLSKPVEPITIPKEIETITTTAIDEPADFYIDRYGPPKIGLPNERSNQRTGKGITIADFMTVSKPRGKKKKLQNASKIDSSDSSSRTSAMSSSASNQSSNSKKKQQTKGKS